MTAAIGIGRLRKSLQPAHRRLAGSLPLAARRRYLYFAGHLRVPDLENPRSFTEKVNWRIINDRRDVLAWTCDKVAMKDYARSHAAQLDLRVPSTLWAGADLTEVVGRRFETGWVLKPNHRSGLVFFGESGSGVDEPMVTRTAEWLNDDQGVLLGEWAYSRAQKCFLIEEDISPTGRLNDYKFFVFGGSVALIQVDQDRFTRHTRNFYSRDWTPISLVNRFPTGAHVERPALLDRMTAVAETLGAPFDFIRVDLYSTGDAVWFGEVTPYPGGGVEPFRPREFDMRLGMAWELPRLESVTHREASA